MVITGVGSACGLGVGAESLWAGLVEGRSGIGPIERFDPSGFASRLGAEVKDLAGKDHVPKSYRKAVKVMARDTEIAVAAAAAASRDAALVTRADGDAATCTYPPARIGCNIGAGFIASDVNELTEALVTARFPLSDGPFSLRAWGGLSEGGGGMGNLQPLWMLKYLPNMPACHVTIIHGLEGPSNTITCGESSGLLCIGESTRMIERGDADAAFAGGAESKVNLLGLMKRSLAGRLASTADGGEGWRMVRPYDPAASGTLLGEGGAIVILEDADHAAARGATIYAEVTGFGAAQSVLDWPDEAPPGVPDGAWQSGVESDPGEGLALAIEAALRDAGLNPSDIDAIVPQGLGVAWIDQAEAKALSMVFGHRLASIPLVTLSPQIGDTVAGHGAIQAAAAALCVRQQRLPARLHAGSPMPGLNAAASPACDAALRYVLVCTSSLGGQNAALILRAR